MTRGRGRMALLVTATVLVTTTACVTLLMVAYRGAGVAQGRATTWLRFLLSDAPAILVVGVLAAAAVVVADRGLEQLRQRSRDLDGLAMRVRMADEAADRHRRLAETASAGMFELLSGLVAAEEGARGQLAAELHDTVAQSLASARVLLDDAEPTAVVRAAEMVAEAEDQVRAVMARTRPPALRDGDLARAVATLRDDLALRYGVAVELSWPVEPYPLPLVMAVTVYRFFQEALLNVARHADVDMARAELRVDEESVVAIVSDLGPGFDPAAVRSQGGRHVGLGLLRERARLVGGSLEVASYRSMGATLTLRLPRGPAVGGLLGTPPLAAVSAPAG